MALADSIIETGVDKLVNLINSRGSISAFDAARELGVSTTVVMEWADFLEEEGILNIEYKFTKPFLVARKLAKKEVQEKAKEFESKKDIFVRKAEVSLSFLEKESEKLNLLKGELDKIKKELGIDIGSIKDEMAQLEKYEQLKIKLDKKVEEQKNLSMGKLQEITREIEREREKYNSLLQQIKNEEDVLKKEEEEATSIEETESLIKKKVTDLRALITMIEKKAKDEEESIHNSAAHIRNLQSMADGIRERIEKEKAAIDPLVEESKRQTENIKLLQDEIVGKIESQEKKIKGTKKASKKIQAFFKKKLGVLELIETVNKDRNDLEKDLVELIKKARSFQLSSKSSDPMVQISGMEKKFEEVDQRKKVFEEDVKKLNQFFAVPVKKRGESLEFKKE